MTTYLATRDRISAAKTLEEVANIENGLDRVYNDGYLTTSERCRLSSHSMNRMNEIEDGVNVDSLYYEIKNIVDNQVAVNSSYPQSMVSTLKCNKSNGYVLVELDKEILSNFSEDEAKDFLYKESIDTLIKLEEYRRCIIPNGVSTLSDS